MVHAGTRPGIATSEQAGIFERVGREDDLLVQAGRGVGLGLAISTRLLRAMGGEIVKHKYILIGMTTFVLLLPLALTSTKASVRRLGGARWARLHRLIYVCAITGTVHYLWAVKKDTLFPLIYLLVFAVLLGFRLWEHYVGPIRLRARAARRPPRSRSAKLAGAATTDTRPLGDAK